MGEWEVLYRVEYDAARFGSIMRWSIGLGAGATFAAGSVAAIAAEFLAVSRSGLADAYAVMFAFGWVAVAVSVMPFLAWDAGRVQWSLVRHAQATSERVRRNMAAAFAKSWAAALMLGIPLGFAVMRWLLGSVPSGSVDPVAVIWSVGIGVGPYVAARQAWRKWFS